MLRATILALCVLSVWCQAPEAPTMGVVDLTPANLQEHMDSTKHVLLEFYAPWCGWCKKLAPTFAELGKAYAGSADVTIAKLDATQDGVADVKQKYSVRGFPTILLLKAGARDDAIKFSGDRTKEGFMAFIEQHTGVGAAASGASDVVPVETEVAGAGAGVVELTPDNFDSIVLDSTKDVFVKFYAPWCGHCQRMAPAWEQLGQSEKDVVIAKLDASAHSSVGGRFGVQGFPTLKFFSKSDKSGGITYKGRRDAESFSKFIQENKSS